MKFISVILVSIMLSGCAMSLLPPHPSPEDVIKAMCADAKDALLVADIALAVSDITPEQRDYWIKYREGAQKVIDAKCGVFK